jgi:cell division protein FtsW (lipid II flippase)
MGENDAQTDGTVSGESLDWKVHPVVERPLQGLLLIGIIIFVTLLFWSGFGQFYGIFCLVVLVLAMSTYFLPTFYSMDDEGIEITSWYFVKRFRPWDELRNFYVYDVGVHLTTFTKPSRLDAFRGSFIRFKPGNKDRVVAFLNEHIKRGKREKEVEELEG